MNLLEARVALRPRSMSDLLDLAGPFCISNRRTLLPLALATTAVGSALAAVLRVGLAWSWSAVWAVTAAYLVLSSGVFTLAAGELLFHEPARVRLRSIGARFLHRFVRYLVARILQWLVLGGCAALLLVPLPVFAARLLFVSEAVLLESATPPAALARSSRLVLFRSIPYLGLSLALALAPFLFAVAADVVGDAIVNLVFEMGRPFGSLWSDGGSGFAVAGALLSAPFVACASFLGYIDLRTRKEGWDIQLRFTALVDAEAEGRRIAS
jgi:hypothetical protein